MGSWFHPKQDLIRKGTNRHINTCKHVLEPFRGHILYEKSTYSQILCMYYVGFCGTLCRQEKRK